MIDFRQLIEAFCWNDDVTDALADGTLEFIVIQTADLLVVNGSFLGLLFSHVLLKARDVGKVLATRDHCT